MEEVSRSEEGLNSSGVLEKKTVEDAVEEKEVVEENIQETADEQHKDTSEDVGQSKDDVEPQSLVEQQQEEETDGSQSVEEKLAELHEEVSELVHEEVKDAPEDDAETKEVEENLPATDVNESAFEEVDANVSAEKEANADESDMLGESDMTVPEIEQREDDIEEVTADDDEIHEEDTADTVDKGADEASPMEVDNNSSDDVEMTPVENEAPTPSVEKENEDACQEESPAEEDKEHGKSDDAMETIEDDSKSSQIVEEGEDVVDDANSEDNKEVTDEVDQQTDKVSTAEKETEQSIAQEVIEEPSTKASSDPAEVDSLPMETDEEETLKTKSTEEVDAIDVEEIIEKADSTEKPAEEQTNEEAKSNDENKTQEEAKSNEEMETNEEPEAKTQEKADKIVQETTKDSSDDKATDKAANTVDSETASDNATESTTADVSNANDEVNPDVENVQEPEESDVCLIPDTDNEMTDAEKERAILARENAEKEGELAEEAASEKPPESEPEPVQEEAAQEPLLEEMLPPEQSTSGGTHYKTIIFLAVSALNKCVKCKEEKICGFRFKNADKGITENICQMACVDSLLSENPGKYFLRRKKFLVEEVPESESAKHADQKCLKCSKVSPTSKYFFKQDDDTFYLCSEDCYKTLSTEEPEKFNLKSYSIRVRNIGHTTISPKGGTSADSRIVSRSAQEAEAARAERATSFQRRCSECSSEVQVLRLNGKHLIWQTMDFCDELCLGKYQRRIGSKCQTCKGDVPHQSLGKYCVRFGFEVRQFCCAGCLNNFKKGLKTCSCCQKDISSSGEGFLAPVGDKEQFKDFCSQACMRRYDSMCNAKKKLRTDRCGVCNFEKPMRVEMTIDSKEHNFCSNPCFSAFKFVSNIVPDQCGMCSKYFERKSSESFTIYGDKQRPKVFCSRICYNVYIIVNRQITACQWCKVKKYDFDMITKFVDQRAVMMCSLNCLTLYGVSINAFSRTEIKCDNCKNCTTPQYHLTMSDASMRNFCTYQCVMQFQSQFARVPLTLDSEAVAAATQQLNSKQQQPQAKPLNTSSNTAAPFPTGLPKRVKLNANQAQKIAVTTPPAKNQQPLNSQVQMTVLPVISNVASLAPVQNISSSVQNEKMVGHTVGRKPAPRGRTRGRPTTSSPRQASPPPPTPPPVVTPRNRSRSPVASTSPAATAISAKTTRSGRTATRSSGTTTGSEVVSRAPSPIIEKQVETKIITVPPYPPKVRNIATFCRPKTDDASVDCKPETAEIGIQTDEDFSSKILIPVPVPIYVPQPMYMYSQPFPVPVPIPLPIPVPIFIPTTRNSANGILKEIKKIQDKMPADPFEAELLMMAEMVADDKNESDSDSEEDLKPEPKMIQLQYQAPSEPTNEVIVNIEPQNNYGEDVLQMALKMASGEYEEPGVDLESAMTANTITNPPPDMIHVPENTMQMGHHNIMMETNRGGRGRKRGALTSPVTPRNNRSPVKRARIENTPTQPQTPQMPVEKPDANMCLKFTFGVNAWKQWVMTKNADIEKSSIRRRLFKTELLQMTADELNYSLCLFVKEVRKPNGTEYAPDTIYYLVLGIQQYLYENGRIDNIFTDPYYERFTDCLDEVARKFSVLYNDSQYIVTRVEEEHLWECKQLGAHSPHVLLSTLMFFNTKHFNLTNVEEHTQLSFSHIMKHWKRSAPNAKSPGTRNVLLRFYPPQAGLDANPRKKKVYEQQENEENPLRCPVRLYEFYLSKCPESVKTRNDVFYLQPERSCVPDSPVWYSTQALSEDNLQKMLHRVKMVKEINIALLTS